MGFRGNHADVTSPRSPSPCWQTNVFRRQLVQSALQYHAVVSLLAATCRRMFGILKCG